MSLLASTLPSNDGYVAAAYIVFFALILVYVAIMAVRLSRVERKLRDMQDRREPDPEKERELV
ncbi:MAG: CcmD family protein [Solirubrobacteraceae bacterium]